jgi:ABC-type sugar transport system ATPase subunit
MAGLGNELDQPSLVAGDASAVAMRATGMRKQFDGVEVLHGVDLELRAGEVHALLGENGAGKSTIINLLSGRLHPDDGHIELLGQPVSFRNPMSARRAGVSVIAQELEVVPTMTVVENIFLGAEPTSYGLIRWSEARRQVIAVLQELGVIADLDRIVGTMSVADQQMVEIAKAVVGRFRVLIMDEPTSALNLAETERLFKVVRRLRADGVAVLYVSHRLWEVFDLADRVTVLRDGTRIMTDEIARTDLETVIGAMLGSKSSLAPHAHPSPHAVPAPVTQGFPALQLEAVSCADVLREICLSVYPGEVVGLAGVLGSGRTELTEAVYGLRNIDRGTVYLNGVAAETSEPKQALRHGVFLLPEDRKLEGIFGHLDVRENVILGYDPTRNPEAPARERGLRPISFSAERTAFDQMRAALGIRCSGPGDRITSLSGGNQQKALFARAALAQPRVLLLSEPTRGVDVGAKEEIYAAIEAFAARGIAILVSSSELSELLRLASRIYVLRAGRLVAEVAIAGATEGDILKLMAG